MQRVYMIIALVIIIKLSKVIYTRGNDLAPAPTLASGPQQEQGLIPKPQACLHDVESIPGCIKALKHFKFKQVTKKCCNIVLSLPEDCFGILFPMRFVFRFLLKLACKILSHIG
ncbi:hypothetical protein CARUB_v10018738mg [Capsella rubella]|uniref:Prolamin-like domain-containing protein n=1 Tax=Capsella rubella TaxID=81985 RepID=R0FSL2_9BRAS|nr:hypothetical protein CARUB_v10018738mg [Capsella rubella]